jgi:tetratricopeptide (TPR) repeat protein
VRRLPDFLCPFPRIPRLPLDRWAANCVQQLRLPEQVRSPADDETYYATLNKAALIFSYLGYSEEDKRICLAELHSIAAREPDPMLLRLAIDPWINYGRLLALEGATAEALGHFAVVNSLNQGDGAELGPCRISPGMWLKIKQIDPRLERAARDSYVIDSIRTYFHANDFNGALGFINGLNGDCPYIIEEAALIAGTTAPRRSLADAPYLEAIAALYRLDRTTAKGLAILYATGAFENTPLSSLARFGERLGDALLRFDERSFASAVFIKGLEIAQAISDQPLEWVFLKRLVQMEQHGKWHSDYQRLVSTCHYKIVRSTEGLEPVPLASGNVYEDLLRLSLRCNGRLPIESYQ